MIGIFWFSTFFFGFWGQGGVKKRDTTKSRQNQNFQKPRVSATLFTNSKFQTAERESEKARKHNTAFVITIS